LKTPRDYRDFLQDILSACQSIIRFTDGLTLETYMRDEKTRYAVMRGYEIMGEAVRHVPDAVKSANPSIPWTTMAAVRNRIIQIAAEGRKYGLWLLLSTQRPSKVHSGIVSQCDNLTLMRMNSPNDLAELGDLFGFVPRQLLNQSSRFRQGEALLAGGFVPAPTITTIARRLTVEGGIDVKVPMP